MTSTRAIRYCLIAIAAVAATIAAAAAQTPSHGDPKLAAKAKISPETARTIALRTQAGTIKDWELELEKGGSGLRYSFDIEVGGKIHEIGVDAADGKVLENAVESAADEAKEQDEDEDDDDDSDHKRG
jgi:Peptidase propeptide and YPEB domain